MKCQWLVCLLVIVSVVAGGSAEALASVDEKSSANQVGEPADLKGQHRESHAMKSDVSYSNYAAAVEPNYHPSPIPHPIPASSYTSNPNDTTMGFVYYYLPTVEKYYPKIKDLVPYIKSLAHYEPLARRAWAALPKMPVRRATDRTFSVGSIITLGLLIPVLLVSTVGFLVFVITLFFFPALAAFGKRRRMGRSIESDPSEFDFEQFIPATQSRALANLAARVDNMVDSYMRTLRSEGCLERISCQAGQITNRLGKYTNPIIEFLEPMMPTYMYNKLTAFKRGARSGAADCSEYKCKLPFFGN